MKSHVQIHIALATLAHLNTILRDPSTLAGWGNQIDIAELIAALPLGWHGHPTAASAVEVFGDLNIEETLELSEGVLALFRDLVEMDLEQLDAARVQFSPQTDREWRLQLEMGSLLRQIQP